MARFLAAQRGSFQGRDAALVVVGCLVGGFLVLLVGQSGVRPVHITQSLSTVRVASFLGGALQQAGAGGGLAGGGGASCLPRSRIPKILHQVYIAGAKEYHSTGEDPRATLRPQWSEWCRAVHHDWEYKFWDGAMAEKLLEEHYPWFLETWRKYDKLVQKGDAIRYFILHHYGGLYIDLDVECWREGYDLLAGYDVVLQGDWHKHFGLDLECAMMASVPGHPLWEVAFKLLQERAGPSPLEATGPAIVRHSVRNLGLFPGTGPKTPEPWLPPNAFDQTHIYNGTAIKFYFWGKWFTPCWVFLEGCHKQLLVNRTAGIYNPDVVGYHHYTGTWNTPDEKSTLLAGTTFAEVVKQAVCG